MSIKKEYSIDAEKIAAVLQDAVNRVKTEENPDELNDLKKLFKKNVPFSLRGYVSAYMVKKLAEGGVRGYQNHRERTSRTHSRYQDVSLHSKDHVVESTGIKPPVPRAVIAEEFAKTIFISIGRNRRMYARDLIGLISQAGGIEREKIGDIKVYDNYSFITLFAEDAEKVINLLNGYEYRGRKLSVSYSRKKEDNVDSSSGATSAVTDQPAVSSQTSDEADSPAADSAVSE